MNVSSVTNKVLAAGVLLYGPHPGTFTPEFPQRVVAPGTPLDEIWFHGPNLTALNAETRTDAFHERLNPEGLRS